MLKNFSHQAARLRSRFLVNLCPVLAIVALSVASVFVAIPSAAAAQGQCDCSHLKDLLLELRIAKQLQQNFLNKIPELKTMGKENSNAEFQKFTQGDVKKGVESIPNYKGPEAVDYDSWGRANLAAADNPKYNAEQLCAMTASAIAVLNAAIAASACPAIGEALRAHEGVHLNFCKRIGFKPYEAMHGADRAREEAEAYGAQIKVLQDAIAKLRCGYSASGRMADLVFSGTICDLEKPFTVNGSIINYKFNFTPSSSNSGTFQVSAAGMSVTVEGGGSYTIEGLDTGKPRIATMGSAVGHSPVGSLTGGGKVYIDLTPLDTGECGQK